MKVICAGLPKTGTKTMAEALRILGYEVHDYFEQFAFDMKLWKKVIQNKATVDDYKVIFKDVDAITDMPGCGLWEQFLLAFPEAKVILMERSEDAWVKSLTNQCESNIKSLSIKGYMIPDSVLNFMFGSKRRELVNHIRDFTAPVLGFLDVFQLPVDVFLRTRFRQHNLYVKATCPKDKLLVFNVKDGWEPLCTFLNVSVPNSPFPHNNKKASLENDLRSGKINDHGMLKTTERAALTRIIILLVAFVAIIVYFLFL